MTKVHVHGHNTDVDIGSEDVFPIGGTFTWPTSAAATTIVSDNANDDVAGTGALTVLVEGVDAAFRYMAETAVMTGAVAVTLANNYYRINNMTVMTAGSGAQNAGIITVLHGAVVIGHMVAGDNVQEMGMFTPWANIAHWHIQTVHGSSINTVNGAVDFDFYTRKDGGLWLPRWFEGLHGKYNPTFYTCRGVPIDVEPGEDIRIVCTAAANTVFNLALVLASIFITRALHRFTKFPARIRSCARPRLPTSNT